MKNEIVELKHKYNKLLSIDYHSAIIGALKETIDVHGPITKRFIESAAKRIKGQMSCSRKNKGIIGV